jgi:hypothetical protein
MVRSIFVIILLLNSALVIAQGAEFKFETKTKKFPKTPEGVLLKHEYHFENVGDGPLIISNIKLGLDCPCTKFEYPKTPIKPGDKGTIKVSFDTKGKIGYQDRTLEIQSNAKKSPAVIRFKVMVDNKKH